MLTCEFGFNFIQNKTIFFCIFAHFKTEIQIHP